MIIHLTGGFLGSGKTTAIAGASALLQKRSVKTAVVTNDQGSKLVDSRFVAANMPAGEVQGGCFCCNYADLDREIARLKNLFGPDVIFAESVGSCTDLVATVMKPMTEFGRHGTEKITFSTFAEAPLLFGFLQQNRLPFKEETNYIWQKQLEEAMILVVNKCDLLENGGLTALKKEVQNKLAGKKVLFQNSLSESSLGQWLTALDDTAGLDMPHMDIDYPTYAVGEENLAWLDADLEIFTGDDSAGARAAAIMNRFEKALRMSGWPFGHLKFYLSCQGQAVKWSATYYESGGFELPPGMREARSATLLVNARIQTSPELLKQKLCDVLGEIQAGGNVVINISHAEHFAPGYPTPTYRM